MPGTIQVSVLELMELPSLLLKTNNSNDNNGDSGMGGRNRISVTVAIGKRQYQTWDLIMEGGSGNKGHYFLNSDSEFAFPLLNLHENLVIRVLDNEGNQISGTDVRTLSVVQKGFWDDLFPLNGGGLIHMKLQFILNEQERQKIQAMRAAAMERKQGELLDKKSFTYIPKFAKSQTQTENTVAASAGDMDQEEEYTVGAAPFSAQQRLMVEGPAKELSNGSDDSLNIPDEPSIGSSLLPISNSEEDAVHHTSEGCNSPPVAFTDPPSPPSALILLHEDVGFDPPSAKEGASRTSADELDNSSLSNGSDDSLNIPDEPSIESLLLPVLNSEHDVVHHTSEDCNSPVVKFIDPPSPPSELILLHEVVGLDPASAKEGASRTSADEPGNSSPSNGSENSLNVPDETCNRDSSSLPIVNSENVVLRTSGEICNSPQVTLMDHPSPPSALIILHEDIGINPPSTKERVSRTPVDESDNSFQSSGKDSSLLPNHDVVLHTSGEICNSQQVKFMDTPSLPSASNLLDRDIEIGPQSGCLESSLAENVSKNNYPSSLSDSVPSLSVVDTTCHNYEAEDVADEHASNVKKMIKAFESSLYQGPKFGALGSISKSQGSKVKVEGALKGSYVDGAKEVTNLDNKRSYQAIGDETIKKDEALFGFNRNRGFEAVDARNKKAVDLVIDCEKYTELEMTEENSNVIRDVAVMLDRSDPHGSFICREENRSDSETIVSTSLDSLVLEERDHGEENYGDMLLYIHGDGNADDILESLGTWISPLGERERRLLCITTGGKRIRNLLQSFSMRIADTDHNQRELWSSCSREAIDNCAILGGPFTVLNSACSSCNFRKLNLKSLAEPKFLGGLFEQVTRVVVLLACGMLVLSIQRKQAR